MDYSEHLRSIGDRMRAEFEALGEISHSGSKGREREAVVADLVRSVIPETLGVQHGAEVLSSDGTVSGECDIVVYDRDVPALYRSPGYAVFPIEAVVAVVEVKSKLDKAELLTSAAQALLLKSMPHRARPRASWDVRKLSRHGRVWDHRPPSFHVFAFSSTDLSVLADHLDDFDQDRPRWERIESVYAMGSGWISHTTTHERWVYRADSVVVPFAIEIGGTCQRGWEPQFQPGLYHDNNSLGERWRYGGRWSDDGTTLIEPDPPVED